MTHPSSWPLEADQLPSDLRRAFEWFRNGLTHFSYKPTWCFSLRLRGPQLDPLFVLVVNYRAPNADRETRLGPDDIDLQASTSISARSALFAYETNDANMLLRFVEQLIHVAETHEREEWLRVDGRRVYNPHPKQTA